MLLKNTYIYGVRGNKLELIEWLSKLDDQETIHYLKIVKDAKTADTDWWDDLPVSVQKGIKNGLADIDKGRIASHQDVKKKYGL